MGTRPPISWGDPEEPWAGGHFLKCVRLGGYECLLFGINRLDLALTNNLTYILRGTADIVRDNQQPGVPGLRLKGCGAGCLQLLLSVYHPERVAAHEGSRNFILFQPTFNMF